MAFRKMTKSKYPPRLWSIVGYPGSGKSTFAARMAGPIVVVDSDHRFTEVLDIVDGDVYELSDNPTDNVDVDAIYRLLNRNMPGSDTKTIVVDSLTAIIQPLVIRAMRDQEAGRVRNLAAAFKSKALAMRQLQDAVSRWGTDVLWIYHLQDARDDQAKEVVRATVTQTERARLTRSINVQLQIVQEGPKRGIKIIWARRGRCGMVVWDEEGQWIGMPEKIEEAIYEGLSQEDQDRIESATPDCFPNPETAIDWGFAQGAFEALQHARNAYEKIKRESKPKNAREMTRVWVEAVEARLAKKDMAGGVDAPEEEDEVTPVATAAEGAVNGSAMDHDAVPF